MSWTSFHLTAFAAAALALVAHAPTADVPVAAPAAPIAASHVMTTAEMTEEVARLVNQDRARVGCRPLVWDAAAARAAQAHSEDMARRNYFSHYTPEGRTAIYRLSEEGVSFRAIAENIAYGQTSAQEVVQGWLASPGHRRNIEDCAYTRDGVGFSDGRWTQVFYTPG